MANSYVAIVKGQVAQHVGDPAGEAMLQAFKPRAYTDTIGGSSIAQAGCVPILHMRHFTQHGSLSDELVHDIVTRNR